MSEGPAIAGFQGGGVPPARVMSLVLGLLAIAALGYIFSDALSLMARWWSRDEYSHGYLIPIIALFLIWQKRSEFSTEASGGSWTGVLVVMLGLAMFIMGNLGAIYTVMQYAFLLTLFGLALALFGWRAVRVLFVPIAYLAFMIPLPNFLYFNLSSELQLISSQLGVAVIRLFGISVHLEGNVIDLGIYKLQVVEACSGLRYLFPLMSFGFLCAYLYRGPLWQKAILFLSTIPITILMNSFRIGMIGVFVEYYGIETAEGFLHFFEGWIIFMACVAILFAEAYVFVRFSKEKTRFLDAFDFSMGRPVSTSETRTATKLQKPFVTSFVCLVVVAIGTTFVSERAEAYPERKDFTYFPMQLETWQGVNRGLEGIYVQALKLDDYIVANYTRLEEGKPVNFYVAYYKSQRAGQSAHSPKTCIPGDGWRITDFSQRMIEGLRHNGQPLEVNRAIISKGDAKQLVYYWFWQRGRWLTNEYAVKWFIFWDALTRNRTDGALIRLVVTLGDGERISEGDERLEQFLRDLYPRLKPFIPS